MGLICILLSLNVLSVNSVTKVAVVGSCLRGWFYLDSYSAKSISLQCITNTALIVFYWWILLFWLMNYQLFFFVQCSVLYFVDSSSSAPKFLFISILQLTLHFVWVELLSLLYNLKFPMTLYLHQCCLTFSVYDSELSFFLLSYHHVWTVNCFVFGNLVSLVVLGSLLFDIHAYT